MPICREPAVYHCITSRPSLVPSDRPLVSINLWMNTGPLSSTLHYDSNHNILVVTKGAKSVRLYSPAMSPRLRPLPLHSESANHSSIGDVTTIAELEHVNAHLEAGGRRMACLAALIYDRIMFSFVLPLLLTDALYIPEGWWHQVNSKAGTVALNYWFEGFVEGVLGSDNNSHHDMLSFYLRSVLRVMIVDAKKEAIRHAKKQARAGRSQAPFPMNGLTMMIKGWFFSNKICVHRFRRGA